MIQQQNEIKKKESTKLFGGQYNTITEVKENQKQNME